MSLNLSARYFSKIEAQLAALERDGAALKKRCDPSLAEIQAAVQRYGVEAPAWSRDSMRMHSRPPRPSCDGCALDADGAASGRGYFPLPNDRPPGGLLALFGLPLGDLRLCPDRTHPRVPQK
jgi:hypothetical protein